MKKAATLLLAGALAGAHRLAEQMLEAGIQRHHPSVATGDRRKRSLVRRHDDDVHPGGATVRRADYGRMGLEFEIAVRLRSNVPTTATPLTVEAIAVASGGPTW